MSSAAPSTPEWQTFPPELPSDAPRHRVAGTDVLHVGRGPGDESWTNQVVLTHPSVSRRHAELRWGPPRGGVRKLGVRVHGSHPSVLVRPDAARRLTPGRTVKLQNGDRLAFPGACLYVEIEGNEASIGVVDRGGRTPAVVDLFLWRSLRVDLTSGFAWVGTKPVRLEPQQRELLRLLALNPRRALGCDDSAPLRELLAHTDDPEGQYRQQIYTLRKKLGPDYKSLVQTISGTGSYIFIPPPDARYVGDALSG